MLYDMAETVPKRSGQDGTVDQMQVQRGTHRSDPGLRTVQ